MNLNLSTFIEHVRETCPAFEGRVAGASEYAADSLRETENPDYPCCYVVLAGETAEDDQGMNETNQMVTVSIALIVFVANPDNTDRRGQSVLEQIDLIRPEVFRSLIRYTPDRKKLTPLEFESGEVLYLDAERMIYQFDFTLQYRIGYEDRWQAVEHGKLPEFKETDLDINEKRISLRGQILFNKE